MALKALIEALRTFPGIVRKRAAAKVIAQFLQGRGTAGEILADFGEDAAVIQFDSYALLLATDGIMETIMTTDPYWAGYCAVLANVNDIAAMGGVPIAMVDVLSLRDIGGLDAVVEGMQAATVKFGVPIVGGHIHPDCHYNAVDIAILGRAARDAVIYSHTAAPGEAIVFAIDLDGDLHPSSDFSFDTTSKKSPAMVQRQLASMQTLAQECWVTAGKDMSNPGSIGTLAMLLESSGVGAHVDLEAIPTPDPMEMDLEHWLKVYHGCGFVVTAKEEHVEDVVATFADAALASAVVGEVTDTRKLYLKGDGEEHLLFDFDHDIIVGSKNQAQ